MFFLLLLVSLAFEKCDASLLVGASSRSVLPTVNGSTSYFKIVENVPADQDSPGTLVLNFDQGRITIGNGSPDSIYVRDDVRAHIMVVEDDETDINTITVIAALELYMIFDQDMSCPGCYMDQVRAALPEYNFKFIIHAQHNHHGANTSPLGALNRAWYEDCLVRNMVAATLEAVATRTYVRVRYGDTPFRFGLADGRDPQVYDYLVRIARFTREDTNDLVATLASWSMHPEASLGFTPVIPPEECALLEADGRDCNANGRVHTGDFPGIFAAEMKKLNNGTGETIFLNGGVGGLMNPFGVVWEVTDQYPLGDGWNQPPGSISIPRNYRRAYMIGRELAKAVFAAPLPFVVDNPTAVNTEAIQYMKATNLLLQQALLPRGIAGGPLDPSLPILGYALRELFICEEPASDATCVSDNYATHKPDDGYPHLLPTRVGTYARGKFSHLRIGPLQILTIPGEMFPELVYGLPNDFDDAGAEATYYSPNNLQWHVTGSNYTLAGVLETMLKCDTSENPCFFAGLGNDEQGYMVPLSDFRLGCWGTAENCDAAFASGAMAYENDMSGEDCEYITSTESAREEYLQRYGETITDVVFRSCAYGQPTATNGEHYEETLSFSWRAVGDYFNLISSTFNVPLSGRYFSPQRQALHLPPFRN